jgi:serine/threonine protein kinase/Tfp pilus assembly protein PilF
MADECNPKAPGLDEPFQIHPDDAPPKKSAARPNGSPSQAGSDLPRTLGVASAGETRPDLAATVFEPPPSEAPTVVAGFSHPVRQSDTSELPTIVEVGDRASARSAPTAVGSTWQLPALLPGSLLGGRYEIRRTLGNGGMGAVYQADDRELGRTVALKVIRPELARNPEILQRFKQEIVLASKVTDRNIIRIYDLGDANGVKFITMEHVEGEDLRAVVRRGKLSPAKAVEVMEQVVSGLQAAHRAGIIHRDLKPANIMLSSDGRVRVMDFGLARSLDGDGLTQTGAMLGTMEYMSPEQAQAQELDARSDIFTVGLIFYELLTGHMPFKADSVVASLLKRTQQRAVPVSEIDKNIPGVLSNIVSKCLERDPALRYQSGEELLADLRAWQGKSGFSKVSVSSTGLWLNRARELPWLRIVSAGLLGTAILVAIAWYFNSRQNRTARAHAPVSVLVADFQNNTSDPLFDSTLEPMVNIALEGAGFLNAYNRSSARQLAGKLSNPSSQLDANTARLVAVNEGVAVTVTGSLSNRGTGYRLAATAIDTVTNKTLATADVNAANKDELLLDIPKLVAPIRKALGDTTPESAQIEKAAGAFSTSSLAAVHQYGVAMEQLLAGNSEEAIHSFSNAIALDPSFARAYGSMASAYGNLGRTQDAEKYVKLAMEHVDRMTDRERYRVRGLYYFATSNYSKCIDEYGELLKRFPADDSAWANIAACYLSVRRIPEAVTAAQRAVEIVPKGAVQRVVLSFYSSYDGDFATGEREARTALKLNPSTQAYLALAEAQQGLGQMAQAAETYHTIERIDKLGASLAASGLADVASFEGRYTDAIQTSEQGIAADMAAKNADNAAEKLAGMAQLHLSRGQKAEAVAAATKAVSVSQSVPVRVLSARALLEAGESTKAQKLAESLASEIQPETQAYAKIIRGDLALRRGDNNEAINMFTGANQLLDTWIGRFELGRAYLEAGMFVEADSEFDRCMKRRGEALEIFQDSTPTFAYFPPIYYYQGRVREGLKSPGFAEPYRTYLGIRGKAKEDPLLADISRRIRQ